MSVSSADSDNSDSDEADRDKTVRVRCEKCGPRLVALSSVRLLGRGERWQYTFTCTECGSRVRRSADAALQAVLRDAGAVELTVHASRAEAGDAARQATRESR